MVRRNFLGFMGAVAAGSVASANDITHDDIWLKADKEKIFESVIKMLSLIEQTIGHANFNLVSFDESLRAAKAFSKIGAFSAEEIAFIEDTFYADPKIYGFYGKQTIANLTDTIDEKEVVKIDGTGHYLFKGEPLTLFEAIVKDVGNTIILTSGVRSCIKQLSLHLKKIKSEGGNITSASRSLVPPAYSYHSIGDFDVGKKGWGHQNFTANFARTEEFWQLQKLSYVSMRYTIGNGDGVRFEPWHIKIV